jgi:DNA-binding HxlR family transcriptional regulator
VPRQLLCPIASTLDLVGDRWTLLIVRDLLRGRRRFAELKESVENIPGSVLSDRLKLLEREGMVVRRFYTQHPPRAEYLLTPKGHDLGPVVGALSRWGEKYTEHETAIVDEECGHGVAVVYHCAQCERLAPRSRVRIVKSTEYEVRSTT